MNIWLIILGMALVTYGVRFLPLTVIDENALPRWARRGLTYVPIAVLSAIIAPEYVPSEDWFQYILDERLVAGIVAIGVAWFTRSTILTIIVGMVILIALG
jgi:branched-subunit amino acid transport protein